MAGLLACTLEVLCNCGQQIRRYRPINGREDVLEVPAHAYDRAVSGLEMALRKLRAAK
jgi:hypothetical protein